MIWLAIVFVSVAALAPTFLVLRGNARNRDRGEAALALHRAQRAELERDRAEGRIDDTEHAAALLEVQRRTLAAADMRDAAPAAGTRRPVIAALALIPLAAFALYAISGHPGMPSAPSAVEMRQRKAQEDQLVTQLRQTIAITDPHSPRAREGNALLGSVEEARGDFAAAAAAWKAALVSGFDPLYAAHAAEAATRAEGHVSPESAALFRQALAAAPPDAPWRSLVERRLAEP
jgi:cytochrome c-type biogenesis protein CcmH